jgi:replicative DNA helicase
MCSSDLKSGGYHIYIKCKEITIPGNTKIAKTETKKDLIETRAEGGYVVAPPSTGYTLIQGSLSNIPEITKDERSLLWTLAASLNREVDYNHKKLKLDTPPQTTAPGLTPWDDYNKKGDIIALLEKHGYTTVGEQQGNRIYLKRPDGDKPTEAKSSGDFDTERRLLKFWSSPDFDTEVGITPFKAYSILEHKGDSSAAAKKLYQLGYGDRYIKDTSSEVKTERIKVEAVNKVNKETSVISNPGENLKIENIQTALGEEVVITSPGLEAQEEVLKAIALIQQTSKRIYIKEGDTEVREYRYQLQTIINKYGTIQEESGELTDRDMDSFLDEVVILSSKLNPIDRDIFKTEFLGQEAIRELGISEDSLSITVDRLTSTRDKEAQAKDLKKLLSEATQLHDKGEVNKALELLDNTVKDVKLKDKKSSFNKLLEIPTEEDIKLHFSQHSESLRSGVYVNNEELLLPSGGLTGIAGATGHGKTDFLINLTLNAVLNYPDKEFYFFTYEMSQEAILVRFLNTYLDIDLESYSNQRAIKTYFKTGSTQYIKTEAKSIFTAKVKEFFKDIIGSGRLRVKGIDYTAPELNLALSELSKKANVGGFFIDYFQLLNIPKEGYKNYSRQEELKVICQDLNNTAKQLQLPIILGAQFNREVTTPFKLHPTNISEAGDIERILDTLIGIWFTNKKIVAKDLTKAEENDFKNKGLDTPDKLYTYVLKAREIPTDTYELLDYNGKRGKIKNSNNSEESYFPGQK